ncbi:hypothetical protein DFH06DRAFT_1145102 [Mycena polygramma]|nr:hypothetical protein DFH06DRAFT_1145102 [Mycena polygramma]
MPKVSKFVLLCISIYKNAAEVCSFSVRIRKKPVSKQFVDDEADEAKDSARSVRSSSPAQDPDQAEEADDDPFENASERSASITPPPPSQGGKKASEQARRSRSSAKKIAADEEDVIELTTSDEDLEAMDEDDSAVAKRASSPNEAAPSSVSKKPRNSHSSPQSDPDDAPPIDIQKFMEEWKRMNKFYDGNLASMIAGSSDTKGGNPSVGTSGQKSKGAVSSKKSSDLSMLAQSPSWDPPYDGLPEPSTPSPAAKAKRAKVQVQGSDDDDSDFPISKTSAPVKDPEDSDAPVVNEHKKPVKGKVFSARRASSDFDESEAPNTSSKQSVSKKAKSNRKVSDVPPKKSANSKAKRAGSDQEESDIQVDASPKKATKRKVAKGKEKSSKQDANESDDVSAEVSKFMSSPSSNKRSKAPLTMAEYFGLPDEDETVSSSKKLASGEHSTVFLEDIETYRAYLLSLSSKDAPCGVSDVDLQDPLLKSTYKNLPPLPANRQIIAAYDPNRNAGIIPEPVKGGRVKYTIWQTYIRDMLVDNSYGALMFKSASPNFINPSRVSPIRLSSRVSTGSLTTYRLHVDDRIATCVSALFCSESKIVAPVKIGGKSERMRKWISGVFHNQEWERFESLMCLVFGEPLLRAQISTKNAVSFQTMISPEFVSSNKDSDDLFSTAAPTDMFSPVKNSKKATKTTVTPNKFSSSRAKTLLAHNDRVPVYDARKIVVDFDTDLVRLDELLPPFIGEVPFGSFIVVGYTCSVYNAATSMIESRSPSLPSFSTSHCALVMSSTSGQNLFVNVVGLTAAFTQMATAASIPEDVMLLLFFHAVGSFTDNPRTYNYVRRTLRQINKTWSTVVDHNPLAWTHLYISFSSYIPATIQSIRRSKSLPITVVLDFTDIDFVTRNNWKRTDIEVFVDVVFTVLDDSWSRCSTLRIRTADFAACSALTRHFTALRAGSLSSMEIDYVKNGPAEFSRITPLFDDSGATRQLYVPSIRVLSLRGILPRWQWGSPFALLTSLSLCDMYMAWSQLERLLGETQALTHLEIRHLECAATTLHLTGFPLPPLPPLPFVTDFTLAVSTFTMTRIAAAFNLPAIRNLHIICSETAVHDLIWTGQPYFRHIRALTLTMVVSMTFVNPHHLRDLLAGMTSLEELDISPGRSHLLNLLCHISTNDLPAAHPRTVLLPKLRKVTIGCGAAWSQVEKLLLHRKPFAFHHDLVIVVNHGSCGINPSMHRVLDGKVHSSSVVNPTLVSPSLFDGRNMNYIRTPIKWVPPPAECGLLRIPADVLQMVARESAGDYFEAPVSFINQRTNLMLSCRWLNLIVEECAPMWTSYVLSPNMERAELKEMSRNFRDRTLQLRLYFFRAASPLPFRRVDPAPLDEVLAFFHRHAPQCESVNLTLDSYPQWMQVFDAFSRATYLRLKKATFNWYGENLPTRLLETVISDLPFTAAALNTLTTFRSFDMRMDWNHLSRFSSLTVLVIHFLYGDYPPTITQMAGILASSPMLVQLSLLLHIKPTPPTSPIPLLFFAIVPVLVEQDESVRSSTK